jgi:adenylosuccinate lyase
MSNLTNANSNQDLFLINALCPLDGRYASSVQELRSVLSEKALLKYRVQVEINWLIALSQSQLENITELKQNEQEYLHDLYLKFSDTDALRIKAIEKVTNHDVKAVEYWIKESIGLNLDQNLFSHLESKSIASNIKSSINLQKCAEFIHFACTSEDINNISHALMLQDARKIMLVSSQNILNNLHNMSLEYADIPMLSRTHGQTASPTTVGKEMANVLARLKSAQANIASVAIKGKMNGAVGNYNAHISAYPHFNWPQFSNNLIKNIFGLTQNTHTTQIEPHDYMAELFHAISRFNTILIDFNRDIWGYISLGYFKQKLKTGEIGSSTMPHKVNPIDFENSEGNLGLANAILNHLAEKLPISRWQRDLTDSTVLRNMSLAIGYSLLSYASCLRGLNKLELNTASIAKDLDSSWEVLAEPIQTVMRKYAVANPYEQLKELTRGKEGINSQTLASFIKNLDIPEHEKNALLQLSPASYIGIADKLAKSIN